MIPYFMLLVIPFLVRILYQVVFNHGRVSLINDKNDYRSTVVTVFFICYLSLLVFRDRTVGVDLKNYYYLFNKYSSNGLSFFLDSDVDILYIILNWIIGRFTSSFQWVIIIAAFIAVIPIALLYNEDKRNGYLKIALFINTSVFVVIFSALRQSIAIGIGIWCYYFVRKKNLSMFLLMSFLAVLFHHSAFILLVMYPVYHIRLSSKHLWLIIPSILVFYILKEELFILGTNVLSNYYGKYDSDIENTGALFSFLMYLMFSAYSYIIPDERKMSNEVIGLRNFLVLSTVLQIFASVNSLAMRMNYYFIVFMPVTMCKLVEIPKREFRKVALVSKCVMCIFFTVYFMLCVRSACNTKDMLGIVPYISMWR